MSHTTHFADRLIEKSAAAGAPVCVGVDPVLEKLPDELKKGVDASDLDAAVSAIESFSIGVVEAVKDAVPCVKPQSACFERYGAPGLAAYFRVVAAAREAGLVVVGDAKRGDIGVSAAHYAAGNLGDRPDGPGPDSLTINSYLGPDSIEPFIERAAAEGKGLFVLVRTSNPGSDALQTLKFENGKTVADVVAEMVAQLGQSTVGERGYSLLGAVVGATKVADIARMRELMPQQLFLVPGYGAQGGGAEDVKACFKSDGTGAIITSSRGVIYAHAKAPSIDWRTAVRDAAFALRDDISGILP